MNTQIKISQFTENIRLRPNIDRITSILPPIEKIKLHTEPDYYGASHIISKHLGLKETPISNANWNHGWFRYPLTHPQLLIADTPKINNLVATIEQSLYLQKNGFRAHAIGVPFVYAEDTDVKRIPNSVLIMPAHATSHVMYDTITEKFNNDVRHLINNFEFVVACISGMCVKNSNWIDYFENLNIPWITGAWIYDKNALNRINAIMKSFEYVATNSFGSHIPYAAYCACKVFTIGDILTPDPEKMLSEPFYKKNPNLIPIIVKYNSERYLREKHPYFFNGITGARDMTEWAKIELGEANKKDPSVVAKLLGWEIKTKTCIANEETKPRSDSLNILSKIEIENLSNSNFFSQTQASHITHNTLIEKPDKTTFSANYTINNKITVFMRTTNRLQDMLNSKLDRAAIYPHLQTVIEEGLRLSMTALTEGRPDLGLTLIARLKALRLPQMGLDDLRARCFLAMNRVEDAREAYKEELRYFPDNATAKKGLKTLPAARKIEYINVDNDELSKILSIVRPYTMLSKKRLQSLYELALSVCKEDLPGAFVECGVAAGGSSALMASLIKRHSQRRRFLYSFDSFEGMPAPSDHDRHGNIAADSTGWGTGTCASPVSSLQEIVSEVNATDVVVPVKGYFNQTLPLLSPVMGPIALLHMDGDWYESTCEILQNLWHRVVPRGWIQIDDYGFWEGCRKAVDDFFTELRLDIHLERIDETGVRFRKP